MGSVFMTDAVRGCRPRRGRGREARTGPDRVDLTQVLVAPRSARGILLTVTTDGLNPQTPHIVVIAPPSFHARSIVRERPNVEREAALAHAKTSLPQNAPGGPARPGDATLPLPRARPSSASAHPHTPPPRLRTPPTPPLLYPNIQFYNSFITIFNQLIGPKQTLSLRPMRGSPKREGVDALWRGAGLVQGASTATQSTSAVSMMC
jgi:hypothetical protein